MTLGRVRYLRSTGLAIVGLLLRTGTDRKHGHQGAYGPAANCRNSLAVWFRPCIPVEAVHLRGEFRDRLDIGSLGMPDCFHDPGSSLADMVSMSSSSKPGSARFPAGTEIALCEGKDN
jgi:hypothetical protein